MKYQVIYGKGPLSAWFDTPEEAIGFAERRRTLTDAPAVWEYTDRGGSMIWPTTDEIAYVTDRYNAPPPRRGPITLTEAMERAGTTPRKLARDSGIPASTIYRILSGEILLSNTSARNAMNLAEALGADIRDLLAGESARGGGESE